MIKSIYPLIGLVLFASCNSGDDDTILNIDFRQEMREFVIGLSEYSKAINSDFVVIPQNGIELVSKTGEANGAPHSTYLNAIDGNGQEDLFYGYNNDNQATPNNETDYLKAFLTTSQNAGKTILITDYCSTLAKMDDSYDQNSVANYISFAANERELNNIPDYPNPIHEESSGNITSLGQTQNFLYLINPGSFTSKNQFINQITSTNYDLLIMDLFFGDGVEFTSSEIDQLKSKANGGKRLIISYMSIGEAEDYRYYWQSTWNNTKPDWVEAENPKWEGNFKVRYWNEEWQDIIYGNDNSYLKKVLDAGFDGVYLDIIAGYEYFE